MNYIIHLLAQSYEFFRFFNTRSKRSNLIIYYILVSSVNLLMSGYSAIKIVGADALEKPVLCKGIRQASTENDDDLPGRNHQADSFLP